MKNKPAGRPAAPEQAPAPPPEGEDKIPCQSENRAAWKYVVLALIFLAWLAFLIYCAVV
jgi:hypothetical protein